MNAPRWLLFNARFVLAAFLTLWLNASVLGENDAPVATLGTRAAGEDWENFLGPRGDGTSAELGIADALEGKSTLKVVWQLPLGASYGSVCISRGRALLFDRHEDTARLRCLHSETGALLWEYGYPMQYKDMFGYNNGPRCMPVSDGRRVYIYGPEGKLHCVDLSNGKLVWKRDISGDYGVVPNFFGVGSTPMIYQDLLIVMAGGSPGGSTSIGDAEGDGSGIVALHRKTGEERYRITDELASYASPRVLRVGDRDWAFVFARGGLVGFEPATGKVDFQFPWRARILESVNASNPVVVGDQVFITETYGPGGCLLRVRPGSSEVVWRDEERARERALPAHWNTPIYRKGFLYGSAGRHTRPAELRCVEWTTGKVRWSQPGLTRSSLLYVDEHFVCLGEDGTLRIVRANPEKYDELTELPLVDGDNVIELEYPAWAAPVLSHGLLYVRGKDRLVCAELLPPTD